MKWMKKIESSNNQCDMMYDVCMYLLFVVCNHQVLSHSYEDGAISGRRMNRSRRFHVKTLRFLIDCVFVCENKHFLL